MGLGIMNRELVMGLKGNGYGGYILELEVHIAGLVNRIKGL